MTTITVEVSLSEYVDLMRSRKGLTKVAFADSLGVRPQTVEAWADKDWQGVRVERLVQVCSELEIEDPAVFIPKDAA